MTHQKVFSGQPFKPSASLQNDLIDILNAGGGASALLASLGNQPSFVRVKNRTESTLGRFNVVKLGGLNMSDSSNVAKFIENLAIQAEKPAAEDYSRDVRIGITEGSLSKDGVGRVVARGFSLCRVEVTDVLHKYARPTDDDCSKLTSDWWGQCRIVSVQDGTGTKMALVEVGCFFDHSYIGKFISDVGDEDTGTLTVWSGIGAGSTATTGTIEEVYNRYAELLEADKFARVSWDNDGPECVAIRCA